MDRRAFFERLDPTAETPGELFEHFEPREAMGRSYHALPDARHGVERGTVVLPDADAVVRGYPSVPRVLVVDPGLESFFGAGTTVAVEEKLDGYNVRVADVGAGEPLAFTRSGYACPFSTPWLRERLDLSAFFADHPRAMLCAELVGPENPYTSHDYDDVDSLAVRVFDVRDRETGEPLPVADRRERCEQYGFPQPRLFGRDDPAAAVSTVRAAIDELDRAGREGVVVRSADGERMVKYTTEAQHHADLAHAFSLPFEYGRDFLLSRIVRDAFQAAERDESGARLRERAHHLGEAVLLPMVETIRDVDAGDPVGERHTVRGPPGAVAGLLDHLGDQSLSLVVETDRRADGRRVVTFLKEAESTRDRIEYYLDGGTVDE